MTKTTNFSKVRDIVLIQMAIRLIDDMTLHNQTQRDAISALDKLAMEHEGE